MKRLSRVAAAATVIALAIPGVAAADSISLVPGHHWDAEDRGSGAAAHELEGHGFGTAGSLVALATAQPADVSQSVAVDVSSNVGHTAPVGDTAPTTSAGIIQQVAPVAFTSVPPTPVLLAAQGPVTIPGLTSNFTGTILGSLPLSSGGSLILIAVGEGNGFGVLPSSDGASPAPEPASLILLGTGLVGTVVRKRWFA